MTNRSPAPTPGYYRFPTIHGDRVVYVCEDDLWAVSASGGVARRLTSGVAASTHPALSPDGQWLAFTGREEGWPELYVMPAVGGPARRLTFLGAFTRTVGWTKSGRIVFASDTDQPFRMYQHLYTIDPAGGVPERIEVGPARAFTEQPGGRGVAIGRNMGDPARWKRYRGGTAGSLWIDRRGRGSYRRLLPEVNGNLASPMWIADRIYFLSDHEGHGNLYSCAPDGAELERHSDHEGVYARWSATDGERIVYHAGADLWLYTPGDPRPAQIEVEHRSPRIQRAPRFVSGGAYLDDYQVHPDGHAVCMTMRGRSVSMGAWEGPATVYQDQPEARHRLTQWLPDGERMLAVSDEGGEESLWLIDEDGRHKRVPTRRDLGRILEVRLAPTGDDRAAVTNHRNELLLVTLTTGRVRTLDHSRFRAMAGLDWSPDGRWIAYSFANSHTTKTIRLVRASTGKKTEVTRPEFRDVCPSFDPGGEYLYFLGYRDYDPIYDNLVFDLNFPCGVRPFLVTLRDDIENPFVARPRPLSGSRDDKDGDGADGKGGRTKGTKKVKKRATKAAAKGAKKRKAKAKPKGRSKRKKKKDDVEPIEIDLTGISDRVIAFPIADGRFVDIAGIAGKVLLLDQPITTTLHDPTHVFEPELLVWDLTERKLDSVAEAVSGFELSYDRKSLVYRAGSRLRLLKAGDKAPDGEQTTRKVGWLDLERVRVRIDPGTEWRQMIRDAWRLQRDNFWCEDMSGIDWAAVYERYLPLVDRVASRGELSDLLWELQGELGTSHAYEFGGDYRRRPVHRVGLLGADLGFDARRGTWKVEHLLRGDGWNPLAASPLGSPGIDCLEGDRILRIAGQPIGPDRSPGQALLHLAGQEVDVELKRGRRVPHVVTVRTLRSDLALRYRDWVAHNRETIHELSDGRIGYLHVPDMGPRGFAEFHRYFHAEVEREGLIIDVRWNGGGHVSQLLLEKLLQRRVGYDFPRWGEAEPYPMSSVAGPLVALTNEYAGSDGDIFSHCFKLYGLGPLIGKRTWGGVIGIWPRYALVDGTVTTQPEYSFWFEDVGWDVENYGTDPDIEVEITPQDHRNGRDTQLERGLREIEKLVKKRAAKRPGKPTRPNRAAPKLGRARKLRE